ncbi:MAG: helical backbone metal receptor [Acidobacteriota bacterium]
MSALRTPLLVLIAVACALSGCGGGEAPGPARTTRPAQSARPPQRIVTLAPNLTEIAFALGLGPRVVGVSEYVTWPPEALERPSLGGLFDPNLETIVALRPDLAILLPSQAEVAEKLRRAEVATLTVGIESVEDVADGIRAVAARCGVEAAGRELAGELREALAPRPVPGAPRVMLSVDRAPGRTENLLAAGPGTYLHELLVRLGAENVFADSPVRYPQVGMEEVLDRAPEVIVEIRPEPATPGEAERLLDDWRRYPGLPAVERGALVLIGESYALVPGPRLPLLYDRLEDAVRRAARRPGQPEQGDERP